MEVVETATRSTQGFFRIHLEQPPLGPEKILEIFGIPITNSMLMMWLVTVLLIAVSIIIVRRFKVNPKSKFQNIVEVLHDGMYGLVNNITGDPKITDKIFPLIASLFVFIGTSNLIPMVPGLTSFTYGHFPIFRGPTNDFNTTLGLALSMIIFVQIISIKDWGIFGHIGKYIKIKEVIHEFKKGIGKGFVSLIDFFIGLIEIITEASRIISLSLRLFGNMYAHELLTVIIMGAFAYGLPAAWLAMGLLISVVQAIIFGSLTTAYYTMALKTAEAEKQH